MGEGASRDEPGTRSVTAAPHRSGVVALLGRPNAGKSTLLNRLVGEKLAIVTAKAQTTRSRILGILTLPNAQLLLVDTPGLHRGEKALNVALNELADAAAADCDVALVLADPREEWGEAEQSMLERLRGHGAASVLAATKSDLAAAAAVPWPPPGAADATALRISAQTGQGIQALLDALVERLPEAPPLYPGDQLSDRPVRFLVAELVREAAFEELGQELPYAMAVEVIDFDESRNDLALIRANLLVERRSQKQIVVGRNGAVVKRIGIKARREAEKLLGQRVHLELWVKLEPKWAKRPNRLKSLGYR
jgi:GTP-binding protein Era